MTQESRHTISLKALVSRHQNKTRHSLTPRKNESDVVVVGRKVHWFPFLRFVPYCFALKNDTSLKASRVILEPLLNSILSANKTEIAAHLSSNLYYFSSANEKLGYIVCFSIPPFVYCVGKNDGSDSIAHRCYNGPPRCFGICLYIAFALPDSIGATATPLHG